MFGYLSCAVHKLNKALGLCVSIHVEEIVVEREAVRVLFT